MFEYIKSLFCKLDPFIAIRKKYCKIKKWPCTYTDFAYSNLIIRIMNATLHLCFLLLYVKSFISIISYKKCHLY
jgi:hypothetical protein